MTKIRKYQLITILESFEEKGIKTIEELKKYFEEAQDEEIILKW